MRRQSLFILGCGLFINLADALVIEHEHRRARRNGSRCRRSGTDRPRHTRQRTTRGATSVRSSSAGKRS